jgi:hypothetical protein
MKTNRFSKISTIAGAPLYLTFLTICAWIGHWKASAQTATSQLVATQYTCVQRGPYSKVWQQNLVSTNAIGDVTTNVQSYEELSTGICYLSNGAYVDSVEEVDPVPGGAQAVQGRHQVQWALNANTPGGAVTVTTPDAKQISSTVFGLAYYDVATGSNAVIGQLKNCNGTIEAPNQVVYADAFSNVTAEICYTYTKAGLSQDIVLLQAPPAPDSYGLSDETTILQVYTAFFNVPQPEMTVVTNDNVVDDQVLDFGDMKMGMGQAFFVNGQNGPVAAGIVTKQWVQINNSTYLIEAIPYQSILEQLQQLPHASNIKPSRGSIGRLAFLDSDPSRSGTSTKAAEPMKLAKAESTKPRLKVDYDLLSSSTNLTLQGDTTYFVTGAVNITGTTTIEGGTVVKYTNSATAQITGTNIVCLTAAYSPGVFTSMNDNSVGSTITGSTGTPSVGTAYYLSYGSLGANSLVLRNLRFSYAYEAISGTINSIGANSVEVWDCQFFDCDYAINTIVDYSFTGTDPGFPIYLYNVLCSRLSYGFPSLNSSGHLAINAVNMTGDQIGTFDLAGTIMSGTQNTCFATNCLFTSVTYFSGVSFTSCYTNASSAGIYQVVGGASYYLASGSPYRDAGTATIPLAVLADLQTLTTYPPVVVPSGWFTNNYTFFPQAQRDTDTPDIGYHYDPIDFAIDIAVSNATVTVLPGTVLAGYGTQYGVYLFTNGIVNCQGTATSPNYFVQYNSVQEQSNTNWETTAWVGLFVTPYEPDNSSASFGFTDWSVLAGAEQIYGQSGACPYALQNCQLYNGVIAANGPLMSVTNCLFQRVNVLVSDRIGNISQAFYNNLFWEGVLTVKHLNSGQFTFRDNLFNQTSNTLTGTIDYCSNNAYVTTNFGLLSPTNGDVFLTTSPAYQPGALGQYYYPSNLSLIHAGSQSAPAAGLYHYTVTTNNAIEGTNIVSIGFHYVAVGSNGLPLDNNGDGIPDYLEDANGNGLVDSGEIGWNVLEDLGLTVIITQPANNTTIP